jgi:hypothetical protein
MAERSSPFAPRYRLDGQLVDSRTAWLLALVAEELTKARRKFEPFNSPHEGYAVIREELERELWAHVCDNTGRSAEAMDEAIQTAAMALRYVYDLIEWGPSGA